MMNKIILFGLSADMPHKGHIEWISNLKAKFPTHTIVVMPCSANPLGKKDKSGNLIYPSNGFIRWQMLYEYYQKHDNDIIVSQYEIAINTPSKTYTTIQYLQHTSIDNIKSQRGYIAPIKYKNILNTVTIAIGTDIIAEFDKWYKWQKILKVAKIIIMQRAGLENLDLQKISNLKLKSELIEGIQNGQIIEISGPQIDISSRKLKLMLQEKVEDKVLLQYIPEDILKFIKNHQCSFSNSYYSNSKARDTYILAMQAYKDAVQQFDLQRKKNLSAFIADFIKIPNVDKYQTEGYKLTNGRLEIDLIKLHHKQFNQQIKQWMRISKCGWYQTKKPSGKIISPHDFNANFKLLGKYGPNLAIDLIIFIKENTKIKILSIIKNDDRKTLAIPGGFYQGDLLKTAIHEFLEECCSNSLFTINSRASKLLDKLYKNAISICFKKIQSIVTDTFKDKKLDKNITKLYLTESPAQLIDLIINTVILHFQSISQCRQLVSHLKCNFYMHLLPDNYQKLVEFISQNGIISPEEPSITDSRNTNQAWMTVKSIRFLISKNEWQTIMKQCALELSGGDDAASASFITLEKFCNNKHQFALHKYLALRELAKFYEEECE